MVGRYEQGKALWQKKMLSDIDHIMLLLDNDSNFNDRLRYAFSKKLNNRHGVVFEGQQAHDLLALYCLYSFTNKLIIGSYEFPYGRKLKNLLECGIATEEELINDVILGEI